MKKSIPVVWITGHTHSGTTLLSSLLDGHPDCLVYPVEPRFDRLFDDDVQASLYAMQQLFFFETRNALHCAQEWRAAASVPEIQQSPIGGLDTKQLNAVLANFARSKKIENLETQPFDHAAFFNAYFSALTDGLRHLDAPDPKLHVQASFDALRQAIELAVPNLQTGAIPVVKDPIGKFRPHRLDWFFDTWPNGKAIFLRRNPFGRLWSRIQHDIRNERPDVRLSNGPKAFIDLSRAFARDHAQAAFLEQDSRFMLVQYEDLTAHPEHWLRQICQFLDLDFIPSMLQPTCLGFSAQPTTNRTGSAAISAGSNNKWRNHLTLAEKAVMGYGLAKAKTRSRMKRRRDKVA